MAPKSDEKDPKDPRISSKEERKKKTPRNKKGTKNRQVVNEEPRIETAKVGDNECTGVLHKSVNGGRYLEGDSVKYSW